MGNLITDLLQYEGTLMVMNSVIDFFEKRDYSGINVKSLVRELKDDRSEIELHIINGAIYTPSGSLDRYPEIRKMIEVTAGDSFTKCPNMEGKDYLYIYPRRADIVNRIDGEDRFISKLKKVLKVVRIRLYVTYYYDGETVMTF